jgi:glycerol-3-phosphate dehydrogenase (NAD(P)+)
MSSSADRPPVAVLGAGSWGTALAIQFARTGRPTRLWGRDADALALMTRERRNARYLPEAAFPPVLELAPTLASALAGAVDVLVAVPSAAFRELLTGLAAHLEPGMRLAWATKGFEIESGLLPNQVARAVLGDAWPTAVLSGPTFAREVGAGLPTAMTIASTDVAFATTLALDLSAEAFRAYTSADIVGVEVGGAVKNVLAIGAGLSDGLGFGANTRIALITRGLVEMTRLGVALGAKRETFMGLAGLGDVVLSCTDGQSRNRRFGLAIAGGLPVSQALADIGQTVEGHPAARAVRAVAAGLGVSMPISEGIYRVLYESLPAAEVVRGLMRRPVRPEFD